MKPSYSLSVPSEIRDVNLATKARQVEGWLEGLSNLDVLGKGALLADYLTVHDRTDLPAGFRSQLLDMTGPAVGEVLLALEAEFREQPLPLDAGRRDQVELAIRLLSSVAAISKRLIFEYAEYSPRLFGENPLPGYVSRFLHAAGGILDVCYLCHCQMPTGLWLDIHQTGYLIYQAGLTDTPDTARPPVTLMDAYTALLLEAVADPYHFSGQERLWIRDLIARVGHLARVEDARSAKLNGVYGIRVSEDKAPYQLSRKNEIVPGCELLLNTAPLAKKLALVINHMEQGRTGEPDMPLVRHPSYKALLQQLKLIWSGSTMRLASRRTPLRQAQYRMMLGFHTIHRQLASGQKDCPDGTAISCHLVNASQGGVAISVEKPSFHLKIGMLACVGHGHDNSACGLGLVRWFKTRSDGVLMVGIKFLIGQIHPATAFTDDGRHVYPCLLLEQEQGIPREENPLPAQVRLILPSVRLEANAGVEVRQETGSLHLRLSEMLEGSNDIALFRCHAGSDEPG
ncbi:MAG: hypothetical protein P4L70_12725 [Parasulfuritortus sp.]|nr:hypothetical protein [Parasulfuritortus sp.]